jgi:rubredoxin
MPSTCVYIYRERVGVREGGREAEGKEELGEQSINQPET